jgi:hypothetical protein
MLAKLDRRTKEARLLEDARASLTRHIGVPSEVERVLIERCARLQLFIEVMDRRALEAGTMSERDSKQYLAWTGQLRLCLRELGTKASAPEKTASIASIVARHKPSAA